MDTTCTKARFLLHMRICLLRLLHVHPAPLAPKAHPALLALVEQLEILELLALVALLEQLEFLELLAFLAVVEKLDLLDLLALMALLDEMVHLGPRVHQGLVDLLVQKEIKEILDKQETATALWEITVYCHH
ncbi:hypothetical protein ACEWY4_017769 [Coilia grayii]|uniref:Secreted protein n=1 Tax=Coilia grayii TaxID=363190 RepID=A0ABD1JJ93_9TELE